MAPGQDETEIGGAGRHFESTLWTVVLRAKGARDPIRRTALEALLNQYWKPVYFFIRRRGHGVEEAKDLTQAFFALFLEKSFLDDVSQEKGRFRSFLMAAVTHFLSNQYDRAKAKKRGGHLNFVQAEEDLLSTDASPEKAFQHQWAVEVMTLAMREFRREASETDLALFRGESPPGMVAGTTKSRRHRLRQRFRELLIEQLLPSVENRTEAEVELHELFSQLTEKE